MFGLLNINKPAGPTSHDIVARVRRGTRVKKVGHAGTLDPMATGVLVVCLGAATRLSEYAMGSPKVYRAGVRFGVETDTYDAEGSVIAHHPTDDLTGARVAAALAQFQGTIRQVPPMYSAIKQGGKKLYELARQGQEVKRPAREVTITALRLAAWDAPLATLEVHCSPGTYIRSLAHDLGAALGVGAHLSSLERVASGSFTVAEAVDWAAFEQAMTDGRWRDHLLPPDRAVDDLPALHVDAATADAIAHGMMFPASDTLPEPALARVYGPDGGLLAIVERRAERWKPHKVFAAREP